MKLNHVLIAAMALFTSACSYLPFSGGALEGEVKPGLADWSAIADIDIIQLETQAEEPYSVNLWMIAQTDRLWVYAGDNHAQWAQNIDQNPNVRLGVKPDIYELSAVRVLDQDEFQRFTNAWYEKYGSDRRDLKAADTYLYRLQSKN